MALRSLERNQMDDLCHVLQPTRRLSDVLIDDEMMKSLLRLSRERGRYKLLARHGLKPRNRLLFYGPPGNGKTATAEALANLFELPLLIADYSQLQGSLMGESEKAVSAMFEAAQKKKCVLFIDEADSLLSRRVEARSSADRTDNACVNLTLTNLDRLKPECLFIAATNFAETLDPALDRRFDAKFEFPAPDIPLKTRFAEIMLRRYPIIAQERPKAKWITPAIKHAINECQSYATLEKALQDIAREILLGS